MNALLAGILLFSAVQEVLLLYILLELQDIKAILRRK